MSTKFGGLWKSGIIGTFLVFTLSFSACAPVEQMQVSGAAEGNALAAADMLGATAGLTSTGLPKSPYADMSDEEYLIWRETLLPAKSPKSNSPAPSEKISTAVSRPQATGFCTNPYGGPQARGGYAPNYSGAQFICVAEEMMYWKVCMCDSSGCQLDPEPGGTSGGSCAPGSIHD